MKNQTFLMMLLIVIIFTFSGCGTVKKDTTRTEEVTKTEIEDKSKNDKSEIAETNGETNIKKSQQLTVNDQDQTTSKKEVLEPIDATKPASYVDENGKKQELNNAKKTTETTTKKNNTKTEASTKNDTSKKVAGKSIKKESADNNIKVKGAAKKAAEEIQVDRKTWSIWNFLWLLIPIGVYFIWKNKTKIIGYLSGLY